VFDVIVSNTGPRQLLLTGLRARWQYQGGALNSIEEPHLLKPIAKEVVELSINPRDAEQWEVPLHDTTVAIYPPIVFPSRQGSDPKLLSLRLEVLYKLVGGYRYHPHADWDILYEIFVQDDKGAAVQVLSQSWRSGRMPNWIERVPPSRRGRP
jgi:hypothetical protein